MLDPMDILTLDQVKQLRADAEKNLEKRKKEEWEKLAQHIADYINNYGSIVVYSECGAAIIKSISKFTKPGEISL